MKNKRGFALLGLVIALAVLTAIIAVFYLSKNGGNGQSTIDNYVSAEQKAENAKKLIEDAQKAQQNNLNQIK